MRSPLSALHRLCARIRKSLEAQCSFAPRSIKRKRGISGTRLGLEALEARELLSGNPPGFILNNGNLYNTAISQTQPIDTRVQKFAAVNNRVYDLHADNTLASMNIDGSAKTTLDNHVTSFAIDGAGDVVYLSRWNSTIASLYLYKPQTGVDSDILWLHAVSFAIDGSGSTVALDDAGNLHRYQAGSIYPQFLDNGCSSFAVDGSGSVVELSQDRNHLSMFAPGAGMAQRQCISYMQNIQSYAVDGAGSVVMLAGDGSLYRYQPGSIYQQLLDTGVVSFVVDGSGSVVLLYRGGENLSRFAPGAAASQRQCISYMQNIQSYAVDGAGSVVMLAGNGNLYRYQPGSIYQQLLDTGVVSFAIDGAGSVVELTRDGSGTGNLSRFAPGSTTRLCLDVRVYSFSILSDGTLSVDDWFTRNLSDPGLQSLVRQLIFHDDAITRNDMLSIFQEVEQDGVVSSSELASLQALVSGAPVLVMPDYVRYMTSRVVNGDPANALYQGNPLGNLAAGSSANQLQLLVDKWFLGIDHPISGYAYAPVSGVLFGSGGPVYSDVQQGDLGDCWVMASLAEAAARTSSISSMFINNGDGTYTVRFYQGGSPVYVTVDKQLPVDNGYVKYDHPVLTSTSSGKDILWAALAEKAIAQLNASGWLQSQAPGQNSYLALGLGGTSTDTASVLSAITGRPADGLDTGGFFSIWYTASGIANKFNSGSLVVLGTTTSPKASGLVGDHAYAMLGDEVVNGTLYFDIYNPWGVDQGESYQTGSFGADFDSQVVTYALPMATAHARMTIPTTFMDPTTMFFPQLGSLQARTMSSDTMSFWMNGKPLAWLEYSTDLLSGNSLDHGYQAQSSLQALEREGAMADTMGSSPKSLMLAFTGPKLSRWNEDMVAQSEKGVRNERH